MTDIARARYGSEVCTIPPPSQCRLPRAQALQGLDRASLVRPDGSILNTCSTAALVEMLAFLKRSFWPFPWDTGAAETEEGCLGGSGFQGAAEVSQTEQCLLFIRYAVLELSSVNRQLCSPKKG